VSVIIKIIADHPVPFSLNNGITVSEFEPEEFYSVSDFVARSMIARGWARKAKPNDFGDEGEGGKPKDPGPPPPADKPEHEQPPPVQEPEQPRQDEPEPRKPSGQKGRK